MTLPTEATQTARRYVTNSNLRMKWGTWVLVVGFFSASIFGAFAAEGAQNPPPQEVGHVRVETARRLPWGAKSTRTSEATFSFFEREVTTPPAAESVDIVLTLSFDYATTRGDYGEIGASYAVADQPDLELTPLRPPGLGRVTSRNFRHPTTTSITWIVKNVEGAGKRYYFQIGAAARDGDDDLRAKVWGQHFSVVIDILPAGDG